MKDDQSITINTESYMLTFIYCLDENYNNQVASSINSLLDQVTKKINIYIVHNNKESLDILLSRFTEHEFLNELKIFSINTEGMHFPNVENKHVSEATYYRIHLDKVFENIDLKNCIYLDSDIICVNDPIPYSEKVFEDMEKYSFKLGARTELVKFPDDERNDYFQRNNMKSSVYFNAGVLFFNYNDWLKLNYFEELRTLQDNYSDNLVNWDQDLLNILFDGEYYELNNFANFNIGANWNYPSQTISELVIFLHYQGKLKPWELSCIHTSSSEFFQQNYRKLSQKKYLLIKNEFRRDIRGLINLFFKLKITRTKYPISILFSLTSIFYEHIMNTKNKPTNQNTNNKKTLGKVIMIHKGYSKYLEHNIAITSKNNKIFLVGDKSLEHLEKKYNNLEFLNIDYYLNSEEIKYYEENFVNYSTNDKDFEWFCFARLFIIKKFLDETKLNNIFHLDSDNVILRNLNDFNFESDIAYSIPLFQDEFQMAGNICHGLINKEYCLTFEEFYKNIYINKSNFDLIENKIDHHKQNNISGGICDMTLHYLIYKSNKLKIQNLNLPIFDLNNDLNYFIENLNSPEGPESKNNFYQARGRNKIYNGMFLFDIINKKYCRIINIHYQGKSKRFLNSFTKYKLKF